VTGPDPSNVKVTKYGKIPNLQCDDSQITIEEVVNVMMEQIRQKFYQDCIIPPCEPSTEPLRFIVEYPLCHYYINRPPLRWWESCNSEQFYCQKVRYCCYLNGELFCWDGPIQSQGNEFSCNPGPPVLPPPGSTWDEDWNSDCYYDTSCQ
ncbi:MAG: hypothetical protein ACK42G_04430, partial [Candidatus Kapaibacteriota bacterium]